MPENLSRISEVQLKNAGKQRTSKNLSQDVALQLLELMEQITSSEVNVKTVSAACQCASEITKILKLNLEVTKMEKQYEQVD